MSPDPRTTVPPGLAGVAHEPGVAKPDPVLVVDGLRRSFGGVTAVDVEHLEIPRGLITGLIGPNGAGKTTLFNLLTGFDAPDEGDWTFDGRSTAGWPAYRVARAGMVRTFQLTKALSRMTVLENLMLGAAQQRGERLVNALLPWRWRERGGGDPRPRGGPPRAVPSRPHARPVRGHAVRVGSGSCWRWRAR
jgi:neutral amino acid transport system ATP-binding protein